MTTPSLDDLRVFVDVADAGGFTAAAALRGLQKATLSRAVARLEASLGVLLFVRTTRSLRLTDEGTAVLEHARRMTQAGRDAATAAATASAAVLGTLRVSVPAALAGLVVRRAVVPFLASHPHVDVEVHASNASVNVVADGWDVALRLRTLDDSSLRQRFLANVRGGYFASPGYVRRRRLPDTVAALGQHDAIVVPNGTQPPTWPLVDRGRAVDVPLRARLVTQSFEVALQAACAGVGVVRAPDALVQEHIARRALVPVLASLTPPATPLQALMPPGPVPRKTRLFVDALVAAFAAPGRRSRSVSRS